MSRQYPLPPDMRDMIPRLPAPATLSRPATATISPKDILRIVRQRIWMIVIITILSTILSVGLYFMAKRYYPRYTSEGIIECKMPDQQDLLSGQTIVPSPNVLEMETASRAAYLMSDAFLGKILGRDNVQRSDWYLSRNNNLEKMMEDLKDSFSAIPRRNTAYVTVRMSASSPGDAKLILDEAFEEFVQQMKASAEGGLQQSLVALNKERDKVLNLLTQKQASLNSLALQPNAPGWLGGGGMTVVEQEMKTLQQDRMILAARQEEMQIRMKQLEQERQRYGYTSDVSAAVEADRTVMYYKQQIALMQQQLQALYERFGEDHREVNAVKNNLRVAQNQLDDRIKQLQQQYNNQEMQGLQREMLQLAQQLKAVDSQFNVVASRQAELDQKLISYRVAEEEVNRLRQQLDKFDQRIYNINVKLRDEDRTRVQIAMPGIMPLKISFPRLPVFLLGGIFLGLVLSGGLAFLLEFLDDSVKTPSDVARYLNAAFLGMIPLYDEPDRDGIAVAKISAVKPHDLMSEFYRQLRTNLCFSAPDKELKTILITSSSAGCGKTTTAVNLSITMSGEGKRVLLIDANFRRPEINRLFPREEPLRGLSNLLVGQVTAADVIHTCEVEGLELLESGPMPPSPAELLGSQRMHDFLENQKQYYDTIIIDGPPALVVVDARILAGMVDGTIAVVHAEETSRGAVQRMLRELRNGKVRLLGVLLNAVRPRKGGYFDKVFQSYYEYTDLQPTPPAALPAGEERQKATV